LELRLDSPMTKTGKKTPEGIGREIATAVKMNCREVFVMNAISNFTCNIMIFICHSIGFFAAEYGHATPTWRNEARQFNGGSYGLHLWTVRPPRLWNHFLQVGHCTAPCCSDTVFRLSDKQTFSTAVPLSPHCC